jgi:hypothetical protein
VPAKLLGVVLLLAGLLLRHRIRRARRLGYVGPRYRRVYREVDRAKFNATLGAQFTGAVICFIGAVLCFTHLVVR